MTTLLSICVVFSNSTARRFAVQAAAAAQEIRHLLRPMGVMALLQILNKEETEDQEVPQRQIMAEAEAEGQMPQTEPVQMEHQRPGATVEVEQRQQLVDRL